MSDDSLLAKLAEEFTAEMRTGKPADIEGYARKYPKLAERIRELFPTLMMLEGVAGADEPEPAKRPFQPGLSPDSVFGQYHIKREVGRGGMGIVYEAVHLLLEKRVALKVLPVRTEMDAGHLERFFREARMAASLHHTNIVPVFDVGQVAGTPYYAMEYIEGRGLDAVLRIMQSAISDDASPDSEQETASEVQISSGKETQADELKGKLSRGTVDPSVRIRAGLPGRSEEYFRWVARMGIQAAEGLAHAHERKVIHRDIKPSNLLLDKRGVLWITDFGLARRIEDPSVTQSGIVLGTPRYMSPEQAQAAKRPMDQRSDIYSLGATLYELLTCRPVFEGKTPHDVISQILTREPVAPRRLNAEIPADLATIVMKAMAKLPEDRYQSADQLAEDLNRWLRMEPIKARKIGPAGRTIRWCRRNPRLAVVTAIAAALILAISGIYYASLMKENAETRLALQRETEARLRTEAALQEKEIAEQKLSEFEGIAQKLRQLAESNQASGSLDPIISNESIPNSTLPDEAGSQILPDINEEENQKQPMLEVVKEPGFGPTNEISSNRNQSSSVDIPTMQQMSASKPEQAMLGLTHTETRICIGTSAPKDTPWYDLLKNIGQEWERITNGEVQVIIYAGGVLGDEPRMVEMIDRGMIQAAGVSFFGLYQIDNSISCLQIPLMFRSYEELDYVRERIEPYLEKRLEERGLKLLHWVDAGWYYTFAKQPVRTPDELRKMKLFTQAGLPSIEQLYKDFGFRVFPLAFNDMIASLKMGMINAFHLPPLTALVYESYLLAPNMIGVRWMPLVAGTVIDLRVWKKFPEKYRAEMLEAARKTADRYRDEIREIDEYSIRAMQKRGLNIVELDADELAVWQREAENGYPKLRGRYAPADLFDEVMRLRDEFRKLKEQEIAYR